MTEESEKLPAISGVALQMQLITEDTYLAGLWKASLLYGLVWLLDPGDADLKYAKRPTMYRTPL
jgi:hypothetical protein